MQSQRDEAEGDDGQEWAPERLAEEEQERAAESMRSRRVAVQTCLHHEPTYQCEGHAPRQHAEASERVDGLLFGLAHLGPLEVLLERGSVRLDELPQPDPDRD